MKEIRAVIFDMDGTLYPHDVDAETSFRDTALGQQVHRNTLRFLVETAGLTHKRAEVALFEIRARFAGEISIGIEKVMGIPRETFFAGTWNIDAGTVMPPNPDLAEQIGRVKLPRAILSAAPGVWIERVLEHLEVRHMFGSSIFDGVSNVRKPSPEAFMQVADHWGLPPENVLMIGDQDDLDIIPAQSVGMMTLKVGEPKNTNADLVAPNIKEAIELLEWIGMI